MSRRVSIVLPGDMEPPRPRTSSASRVTGSPRDSRRSSLKSLSGTPKNSPAKKNAGTRDADEPEDNVIGKLSMTDLFPDGCERYKKDCCCCHCIEVRRALRQAAYLRSPEGKRRLQLKMQMKDFLLDISAITATKQRMDNLLHGTKQYPPPATRSFPISIVNVAPISGNCMSIEWYQHDDSYVSHYEIYVDEVRVKRIFDPQIKATVVLDVDMKRTHKIRMKAVPRKCLGSKANRVDKLVRDVCCGKLSKILEADYFCDCAKKSEMEKVKERYAENTCQVLVDFWKDSEFLYIPVCDCVGDCTCDCNGHKHNACS
ncbi:PREDICTED: uncharacterized protein LOC108617626 [Drosophila arizonae]|uniref:Uncharacterized protein LOC108617626 n=1 Tax=Drosophila arizonae TaxID=7263 RepID=A0ABM1PP20_DROAR|nr:PREDICTED: uncharacterized protein LOC108617626 [Drosophila arizonae]